MGHCFFGKESVSIQRYIYNFSAGPAMLPPEVLEEVREELTDYSGSGISVMELSHRGYIFQQILQDAESDLRTLMEIPQDYSVLFLQGGATMQFSMVPMNLGNGAYILSGYWSETAYTAAAKINCPIMAQPDRDPEQADYLYLCENETIQGTWMSQLPDTQNPIVSDQSSIFLTAPCDVRRYGFIFAGAQKNVGPAGVTIVILRKDLLERSSPALPNCMNYMTQSQNKSLYNTPNCWGIYVCGKVFRHLLRCGGLEAAASKRTQRAQLLYSFLDHSSLFRPMVQAPFRSPTNITFTTGSPETDRRFLLAAEKSGFMGLPGHKSQGGIRASLYNAMPVEGVAALVQFMEDFEKGVRLSGF